MLNLPIFPLNTVLFPGMPLPLYIFEERYKKMIRSCLESKQPFGVALIRAGQEANGPLPEPFRIGCTARILEVEPLGDGRMKLHTRGELRIRILSLSYERPYLLGKVDTFPLVQEDPESLGQLSSRLALLVGQYMRILNQVSGVELDPDGLPQDAIVLAHLAAVLLQVPALQKQELLGIQGAGDFITTLIELYRREIPLLRVQLARERGAGEEKSSLN